jgi:hypothetical protein
MDFSLLSITSNILAPTNDISFIITRSKYNKITHAHLVWRVVGKDSRKFYNHMACKAWLVFKNVGMAGILNLCKMSIIINEGL